MDFKSTASTAGLEGLVLSSRLELKLKASKASVLPLHHERLERMMRIELTPSAWKAEALPICNIRNTLFNYTVRQVGLEPTTTTL